MVSGKFEFGKIVDSPLYQQEYGKTPAHEEAGGFNFALVKDDYILALAYCHPLDPEHCQLDELIVPPSLRHKQLGSYALRFLATRARQTGARKLIALAPLEMLRFFTINGFKVDETGEVIRDQHNRECVTVTKDIVEPTPKGYFRHFG